MKIKNIFKYLVVASLIVQLTACTSTEVEQKFDKTPTERLNLQKSELKDALIASPDGWKAVYFTDDTQLGGFTHLFKFTADGKVEMASDFDATTTSKLTSEYDIQLGSTVSLVFTTKNRIHLLSDSSPLSNPTPALLGKGYLGDFQFLYYGQENGELIFRANRTAGEGNSKEIRFVKATAQDWTDLPKNIAMMANVIGANTRPLFRLFETNDGTTKHQFDFGFAPRPRFSTANSIEAGSTATNNMGIAYTPTGITVSPAVEVGGQKLKDFVYNATDGSFTATGTNGVTATIKYSTVPLVLTDDYKNLLAGKPQMVFAYISANLATAPSNSAYYNNLIAKVNATLPATQQIARVQIVFNNAVNGTYIQYQFNGGKAAIAHFVTTKEDAVNKTIILTDDGWTHNLATRAFLLELDAELTNPKGLYVKREAFRITFSNTIYTFTSAASNFRMTSYQL